MCIKPDKAIRDTEETQEGKEQGRSLSQVNNQQQGHTYNTPQKCLKYNIKYIVQYVYAATTWKLVFH
jgi:hypothetical protein